MSSDRSDGFTIFADMDPAALQAMFTQIEQAIGRGIKAGFDELGSAAVKAAKSSKMTQASKIVGDAVSGQGKAWSAAKKEVREYDAALTKVEAELLTVLKAVQAQTEAIQIQNTVVRSSGSLKRQEYITERDMANRQMELEREGLRNIGRERYVAAQKDLVLSRQSGTQRIQITQHVLQTIARLEKSLAATVTGVARTAVSATKSLFSGLGSILTRHNSDYTKGLSGSLKSREGLLRGSFGRQERDLRASVQRQNAAMAGLRTGTQTGVLGAVSRSGLLGLAGGAGLLMAAKKTFTIGADFTQGLAVLEAQLGLTKEEMAGVRALSIQLGNDLTLPGVSALDAAGAIQILAKQFGSMGPAALGAAEDAAKGTLQLARAANVGAEEAAGVVGAAINVFGIAADQAVMVADQVTAAIAQAAGVSFSDFADSFKQGAAVFAQFQVPAVGATEALVEFDTALAAIARAGVVGSDAGTSLKQFFLQANRSAGDAGIKLKELTERAGETGTAFYDAAGKARPFSETLDILRKGLVGYTDEQRNSTLQTIFGSDAIRVANALIGISTEEYKKMTDQIRVQGLAAKIAAAQNTGFRGALDALKSVIETVQIVLYEKISPALASFTLGIASAANAVFFGKEAWSLLRRGLLGVAAGMGAVIAMKAASEVIRLLGTSLKLALTPFGAFLIVAGLVGGAIAILTERSPALKKTLGELGDKFKELGGNLREKVQPALDWLSSFITDTLVPAIDRLAAWLARRLIPIFNAVSSFITDTAIPAVKDFVRTLIDLGVKGFDFAVEKAKAFWHAVGPIVQPLIDRFVELKDAVKNVFSGDLSGIGKQWGIALAAGLGLGLVNPVLGVVAGLGVLMGPAFVKMLAPVAKRVGDFFSDTFSSSNMKKYASGFLALVEEAGRIVGSLVSHPTFIKAIAAIAAAAVVIGAKFVLGFAKGVIDHLDDLWRMILDGLKKALGAAFDNLAVVLGVGFALALFGPRMLSLWRAHGMKAGQAAGAGIQAGILSNAKSYMVAFVGGPTPFGPSLASVKSYAKEVALVGTQLRAFGSSLTFDPKTTAGWAAARGEVTKLQKELTPAQQKALLARDAFIQFGKGVKTSSQGAVQIMGGVKTAAFAMGDAFTAALAQLKATSTKDPLNSFAARVKSAFETVRLKGMYAFDGIKKASGTAFGGVVEGWGIAGKALQSGLETVRLKGMYAFDGIKKASGTAFGGVVAGWKIAGAAISSSLQTAALKGMYALETLKGSRAFGAASAAAGAFTSAFGTAWGQIKTGFTTMMQGIRAQAEAAGISAGRLMASGMLAAAGGFLAGKAEGQSGGSGLTSALMSGLTATVMLGPVAGAIATGAALVGAAFGKSKKAAEDARKEYEAIASSVKSTFVPALEAGTISVLNFATAMQVEGGQDTIFDALEGALSPLTLKILDDAGYKFSDLIAAARGGYGSLRDFIDKLGLGSGIVGDAVEKDIIQAVGHIKGGFDEAERAARLKGEEIAAGTAGWAGQVVGWAETIGKKLKEGFGGGDGALANLAGNLENLHASKVAEEVGAIGSAADEASGKLEIMLEDLNNVLFPDLSTTAAAVANAVLAVGDVGGLGSQIQTSWGAGGRVGGTDVEGSRLTRLMLDLESQVAEAVRAGLTDGTIVDEADAASVVAPIKDALLAQISDPALRAIIEAAFADVPAEVVAVYEQGQIASKMAEISALIESNPSMAEAWSRIGRRSGMSMSAAVREFIKTHPEVDVSTGWGQKLATNMALGWAQGLANEQARVAAAASGMARAAKNAIAGEMQMASPSKVMIGYGENVGEGFALGMESMTARVADAAGSLAESALLGIGSIQPDAIVFDVGLSDKDRAALSSITVGLDPADRFIDYTDPEATYGVGAMEQDQFGAQPEYEPPTAEGYDPVPDTGDDYEYSDPTSESLTELLSTATQMSEVVGAILAALEAPPSDADIMVVLQEIADASADNGEKIANLLDVNSKTLAGVEALPTAIAASADASRLSVDAFVAALGPALSRVLTQSVRAA